jgi:NDP-sugar pyrophosphorylase family protein
MRVAVLLAGGLGTRVAAVTGPDEPKALLPVAGRPFIEWKLRQLASLGVTDVLLLTGHGGDRLREAVGDGAQWGVRASCRDDGSHPLGTGGAIRAVLPELPELFWVTYGDSLVEAPLAAIEAELDPTALATMTVLRNDDRWQPSNVEAVSGTVRRYSKGDPPGTYSWIDYGLLLFRSRAFDACPAASFDLREVIERLVAARQLRAYEVTERFHDIGTVAAWHETDEWARASGLAARLDPAAAGGEG